MGLAVLGGQLEAGPAAMFEGIPPPLSTGHGPARATTARGRPPSTLSVAGGPATALGR